MKKIIFTFLLLSPSIANANPCDVISRIVKSGNMVVKVDSGDLIAGVSQGLGTKSILISVLQTPDQLYKAFFKGEFTYAPITINRVQYCYLERTVDGEVINSMAIIEDSKSNRIYHGLGSRQVLRTSIETDTFVTFTY